MELPGAVHYGLNTDEYGKSPDVSAVFTMYINTLATEGYTHFAKWSYDFAPESKLNTRGMTLLRDAKVYRLVTGNSTFCRLYAHPEAMVYVESYYEGGGYPGISFRIAAKSEKARDKLHEQLQKGLVRNAKPAPADKISVNFWRGSSQGGDFFTRDLDYCPWDSITQNYPGNTRDPLSQLISVTPDDVRGKLLLFHGPAGTGKTTLLCSLAKAWEKWAVTDYIIDPEVFLNQPGYMVDVLLGKNQGNAKYRLVILEDSGELINKNAKQSSGQALSRLLNLTDGMLGSGRKILIAITTNDKIQELHPAVTRPGRCLINAEIGHLSQEESQKWLVNAGVTDRYVNGPMTLAELYNIRYGGDKQALGTIQVVAAENGQYL